ncbi:MAG: MFS transporter [Caldilineaceae bacterium SB0668_bin_21]|nr:MFS transporter [Caldilineaceae bacterium SB0668_bin_21]MYC22349.1 MFS transporter [Caldilineaceae bacterium SB0662_bin_25]
MTHPGSLWRNRSFARLWVAHVTSGAGTAITNVALPLAAVLVLGATPTQMGLLAAAGSLPNLLFGLLAGVWIDRVRRKPILIWADIGRALLLVTIPVAAWLGQLSFLQIWLVTFAAGTLTVFFQIAAISVLPALVEKRQLVEANSRLSTSDAVIAIAGPAAAGGLVQLFSAPRAILVDAVSYLLSALALGGVAEEEPQPASQPDRDDAPKPVKGIRAEAVSIGREVGEGVFELLRTPLLRALTFTSSLGMLAGSISAAVQMLFLVNQLHFTPSIIGIVAACSGIGSLAGAMLAGRAARHLQAGRTLLLGKLLWIVGALLLATADLIGREIASAGVAQALVGLGSTLYFVNQLSLRQAITSVRLLGRVTAARRFVLFGVATVGAFIGGALGESIGLRATLLVGSAALAMELVLLLLPTIRRARIE